MNNSWGGIVNGKSWEYFVRFSGVVVMFIMPVLGYSLKAHVDHERRLSVVESSVELRQEWNQKQLEAIQERLSQIRDRLEEISKRMRGGN